MEFRDIPSDVAVAATEILGELVCRRLGVPRTRLKSIQTFDPSIPERAGLRIVFDPELTVEERARLREVLTEISRETGGRPPIFGETV